MQRPTNTIRRLIGGLARGATLRPPVSKERKLPANQKDIQQAVKDYTSLIGGVAGTALGGNYQQVGEAYEPVVSPVMKLLAKLGLDPYAGFRSGVQGAANAMTYGEASNARSNRLANMMRRYFRSPSGGTTGRAAGYGPSEQSQLLNLLANQGLGSWVGGPYGLGKVLEALGAVEEKTGNPNLAQNMQILNKLVGPITAYRPNQLEAAARAAMRMKGL